MATQVPMLFPQAPQADQKTLWWRRRGPLGWWLALTAPPRPSDMTALKTRERVRKGELTSITIFAVFAFVLMILSNSLSDPSTMEAAIVLVISLTVAAIFNRLGHIMVAAYLVVIFMVLVIALSLVEAKGGLRLIWFTTYDLFAVPVFFSALIIHRRAAPILACICIAFVVADYALAPHALLNSPLGAHHFDELQYEVAQPFFNWWALINRNVGIILFSGFFSWLAAFSFEKALVWAEQAKDEAAFANAFAEYKEAASQELSHFLNEMVDVFVAQANNEIRLLRPRASNDPFYQATLLLNERIRRFAQLKRQQDAWGANLVSQDVRGLSNTLTGIMQGQVPIRALTEFQASSEAVGFLAQQIYTVLKPLYAPFFAEPPTSTPTTPVPPFQQGQRPPTMKFSTGQGPSFRAAGPLT